MSVIALRYAHAFASVAGADRLDSDAALQQLRDFAATFDGSAELREILMDPSVQIAQKLKVLDAMAPRIGMFKQVRNFIAVVMGNARLDEINEIVSQYAQVADSDAGVADAEITSAHALNEQDRALLEAEVAKLAGGRVRATYRQDPALLGGAVVKIGSTVYDGSIRSQLAQLKQKLVNA